MTPPPTLIARQTLEIQDGVLNVWAATKSRAEVVEWLGEQGIVASRNQVSYYLNGRGVTMARGGAVRFEPAKSVSERIGQYIAALLEYPHPTFTIHNIGLRGAAWSVCSRTIHDAGLITPTRTNSPIRYERVATNDELRAWLLEQE